MTTDRFIGRSITARQDGMPGPLRDLHRAVLRRFLATGAAPTARWLSQAATDLGLGPDAIGALAAADTAQAYLTSHGDLDAEIIDQDTAIERGRRNFGTLLGDPA